MDPLYNPILPPKNGYVEDIDGEGNHYYRKFYDPLEELEQRLKPIMSDTDAMLVDHELRLSMVELGLDPNDESEV